jgi:hypothetical protein
MPNRTLAVAILAFWLVMMGLLVERDVLPQWLSNQVDLESVAKSVREPESVRWAVLNGEERIGTARTGWRPQPDAWAEFYSEIDLKEVPFFSPLLAPLLTGGLKWQSGFHVEPDGNLHHFDIQLFLGDEKPWMTVRGKREDDVMRVQIKSGTTFTREEKFYYEPRSLLTASLTPFDRLPNLKVGQKWQYRVLNPLLQSADVVRCEVASEQVITWRGDPAPTYLVEQHYGQIRTRCWVARDGMVIRQEVPLGLNPIVLERE